MPTVPTTRRVVSSSGLPNARLTGAPTRTDLGAQVGELAANIGVDIVQRQNAFETKVAQQERAKANEIAVLGAQRRLAEFSNKTSADVLSTRGADSFELPESTRAAFDTEAAAVSATLSNDEQRIAFQRIQNQERDNLDGVTQRHVAGQRKAYDDEQTEGVLKSSMSAAVANAQDPRRVGVEIRTMVDTIRAHGRRNGSSTEATEQRVDAVVSDTHVQAIESLLADGNDRAASVYFEEVRDAKQLQGPAIAKIQKAVDEGKLRGQSQREADQIISSGKSPAEQLDAVRKIEDPKLRDATRERVEHEQAIAKRDEEERHKAVLVNAGNMIDKSGTVNTIPPAEWSSLTVGEKSALKGYAKQKAEGVEPTTDYGRYYEIVRQVRDDPQAFASRNLWLDRSKLSDSDFKQLAAWQTSTAKTKPDPELDGFLTNTQVAKNALVQAGIDPDPTDKNGNQAQTVGRFLARVNDQVLALQNQTGKKATAPDVQRISDALLVEVTTQKGSWSGLWTSAPFSDTRKRALDVGIGDVPASDRAIISKLLQQRGKPVDDQTIVNYYLQGIQAQGR